MTPERWERVKALFAAAVELPVAERATFVKHESQGDGELAREVASLLASAEGSDSLPAVRAAIAAVGGRVVGPRSRTQVPLEHDAAFQPMLETALGNQYEIVRPLGYGGMGAVYLARERALERFVAIKVLRPDLAAAHDGRERFRREARVVAGLSHPGILPLHTFGEVGGTWYFVMGYVRGASLAERLRVEGRISVREAHRILTELADALECAHRSGVVHRDIKPANVLLDEKTGRAVLADFGISKVQGAGDSLTATGMVVGTPHYMSPEQALGAHDVDERTDLYSLGAVGYAMLAGHEPFAGSRADELAFRRASHDAPPLQSVAPSVPAELAGVVMRCLMRDPALRWPHARALKEALTRAGDEAADLPESARDLPTFGPYALLWVGIWGVLAARPFRSLGDRALLVMIALIVPVGLVLHVWNVGDGTMRFGELARVAFWPPEWWGMWWPRALRRPTDLWPRLPWPARAVRVALSTFIVALPAMILMREWVEAMARGAPAGVGRGGFVMVELGLVTAVAVCVAGALAWAMRRGLSPSHAVRLLFGATTPSRGWTTPAIARMLTRQGGGVRPPDHDVPSDHVRAIAELAARLPPAVHDDAESALELARRLLQGIDECDAEIATLSSDASAAEVDRLAARLDALATDRTEAAEHRELAELVGRQLEVVRRMRVRCELVGQRRARLFSLVRGLWVQLSAVHAATDADDALAGALARMRSLEREARSELDEHVSVASSRPAGAR